MPKILKSNTCSHCGTILDSVTAVNDSEKSLPQEGSLSICFTCGNLAVFNPDHSLRDISITEKLELMRDDPVTWKMIALTKLHIQMSKQSN